MRSLHNSIISGWHVSVWTVMELFGMEFPPPLWMGCQICVCFKQLPNMFFLRALKFQHSKILHRMRICVLFMTSKYTNITVWSPRGKLLSFRLQGSKWQEETRSSKSSIKLQKGCAQSHTVSKIYHSEAVERAIWWELLLGSWLSSGKVNR